MTIRKIIKKYGNSAVIVLTSEDLKVWDVKVGDTIEFEPVGKYSEGESPWGEKKKPEPIKKDPIVVKKHS